MLVSSLPDLMCSSCEVVAESVSDGYPGHSYAKKCRSCGAIFENWRIRSLEEQEDDFIEAAKMASTLSGTLINARVQAGQLAMPGVELGFPFASFHTTRIYRSLKK